ncbi:MAG: CDP-diacylglycerol--glycerol-3-phosphate 3-phosphatidyltransferase [Bacilli bacterium]|nr:CDP-diacylglycerol--glycerol-3-phosphate 3-phosphatidyltransferase [Bacilli bacterium]MDD3896132.1 CDP-diacylglycerol--glycerol-3-phosphate 3-phosphatidyltransferase [Bacilli bacterium]MDD4408105.1 CDP-diacylglycerol--glycerol-3-phosphate 3-phosphatidyltransferase [Bacilli bacterium]
MNLPNKITIGRIILAVIILLILVFPFHQINYRWPTYLIAGSITINIKYIIAGVLFMIASFTDFLDGKIARDRGIVTDFGKVMDAIADKVLVNGVLIALAYDGFLPIIIPITIIIRDIAVDSIKMVAGSSGKAVAASMAGKIKTMFMMVGLTLIFFYNLPFELWNISLGNYLVFIATILSVYSGVQYFIVNKEFLVER